MDESPRVFIRNSLWSCLSSVLVFPACAGEPLRTGNAFSPRVDNWANYIDRLHDYIFYISSSQLCMSVREYFLFFIHSMPKFYSKNAEGGQKTQVALLALADLE